MSLRVIHIANHKGRESNVSFSTLKHTNNSCYSYKSDPVSNARLRSGSVDTSYDKILSKHGSELVKKILTENVDVDIESFGKLINDSSSIYLDEKGEFLYSPPQIKENILSPQGDILKTVDPVETHANVRDDTPPLVWTKTFVDREEAIRKYIFRRSLQLFHNDGLTYDFLYEMAKELNDRKQMVLLGPGENEKSPLILQNNGSPYRGFLDGYISDKGYKLFIRLSNQEIRLPK